MRRTLVAALLCVFAASGCRILSGEVACERNRDCPSSVRFCDATDGGVGACQEERPEQPPTDAGPDSGAE